jgi:hypothetical protein
MKGVHKGSSLREAKQGCARPPSLRRAGEERGRG